jgi:hypothetical protein
MKQESGRVHNLAPDDLRVGVPCPTLGPLVVSSW